MLDANAFESLNTLEESQSCLTVSRSAKLTVQKVSMLNLILRLSLVLFSIFIFSYDRYGETSKPRTQLSNRPLCCQRQLSNRCLPRTHAMQPCERPICARPQTHIDSPFQVFNTRCVSIHDFIGIFKAPIIAVTDCLKPKLIKIIGPSLVLMRHKQHSNFCMRILGPRDPITI